MWPMCMNASLLPQPGASKWQTLLKGGAPKITVMEIKWGEICHVQG